MMKVENYWENNWTVFLRDGDWHYFNADLDFENLLNQIEILMNI